jgi:hypothetical protein
MARPIEELIQDFDADPSQWEIIKTDQVQSTNRRNRGGSSV